MDTFRKFAIIITSTVLISFATSMLFFGALCHSMGPEDGFGDLTCCYTNLYYCLC